MTNFPLSSIIRPTTPISILDVGASVAGSPPPYEPLLRSGNARLTAFEPNEAECAKLSARYGAPHRFLPHFVGDGKPAIFRETNWYATGSLYLPNRPLLEKFYALHEQTTLVTEHPVKTLALDDIADLGNIDYLKIDVQGAELSVFFGAERTLAGVVMIQTEVEFVELYQDQPLFADVDRHLRSRGFMFLRFLGVGGRCLKPLVPGVDPTTGSQHLWGDALYIRNWLSPQSLSEEQLIRMATLSHDIYGLTDFCHMLLTALDERRGSEMAAAYRAMLAEPPSA